MRLAPVGVFLVRRRRYLTTAMLTLLLVSGIMAAQETDLDPNRVFTTELHWERVAEAPRGDKVAHGTLVILYLDGTYAEVRASFIKTGSKVPVGLNLNEGFIVRLGDMVSNGGRCSDTDYEPRGSA